MSESKPLTRIAIAPRMPNSKAVDETSTETWLKGINDGINKVVASVDV
jgi:hypothetical protein